MTIKRSDITDIESAKSLKYNGKDLSDDEKKIFEKLGDNPSLDLIRDTAELLEKVKDAQDASEFKRSVFNALAAAKRDKKASVAAINTNSKQFDNSFAHQLSLRAVPEKNDDSGERTKEFLEKKIEALEVDIAGLDISIAEEQKAIDNLLKGNENEDDEIELKKKQIEYIEDFKTLLEGGTIATGRSLYRTTPIDISAAITNLKNIVTRQRTLAESQSYEATMWQVGVPSFSTKKGKKLFMNKRHLRSINYQIVDILKGIGEDKVKAAIDKCVSATNKKEATELWGGKPGDKKKTEDMGIIEKSDWYISKRTDDVASYKINTATYLHSVNSKKKKHLEAAKGQIKELKDYPDNSGTAKAVWPYRFFNDADFFRFMEIVFPENEYGVGKNPSGDDITKELSSSNFTINVGGVTKDISKEQAFLDLTAEQKQVQNFEFDDFAKQIFGSDSDKELKYEKFELPLSSVIEFFWAVYKEGNLFTNFNSITNTSKTLDINTTREEIDFIKNIRDAGIDKNMISDEVLLEVTEPTMVYYSHLVKNGRGKEGIKARKGAKHALAGKIGIDVETSNITPGTSGDWRDYVDTSPLRKRVSKLKAEKRRLEVGKGALERLVDKYIENQANFEAQKRDKQHEIDNLKKELILLESKDNDKIKKEIRDIYKNEGKDNTRPEIDTVLGLLVRLEELEKAKQKAQGVPEVGLVEQDLKDIKNKLETLNINVKDYEVLINHFQNYGKTSSQRALNKKLNDSELGKYKSAYQSAKGLRKLSEEEDLDLKAIEDKLAGKLKEEKDETSDLTETKLGEIFKFTVEKTLLDKWTASIDGKTLKEADIKRIVGAYWKDTDNAKFTALTSHLREKGVVGGDRITEATPEKIWESFLKNNEPSAVIKTIVTHENEDVLKDSPDETKRNTIIERMKSSAAGGYNADHEQNKFDKGKYGNPEEPDTIDKDKLFAFLYDEKLENISQQSKAWKETTTGDDNGDEGNKSESWKDWFVPRKDNILKPCVTYIGGLLVIAGVAAVIFWKKISDWWNGPAEEQGEGETGEEKEEENE